jgi:hypothetical protein
MMKEEKKKRKTLRCAPKGRSKSVRMTSMSTWFSSQKPFGAGNKGKNLRFKGQLKNQYKWTKSKFSMSENMLQLW